MIDQLHYEILEYERRLLQELAVEGAEIEAAHELSLCAVSAPIQQINPWRETPLCVGVAALLGVSGKYPPKWVEKYGAHVRNLQARAVLETYRDRCVEAAYRLQVDPSANVLGFPLIEVAADWVVQASNDKTTAFIGRQPSQKNLILETFQKLGIDPKTPPNQEIGCRGHKAAVWEAVKTRFDLFVSKTVFDKVWQVLLDDGDIVKSKVVKGRPKK